MVHVTPLVLELGHLMRSRYREEATLKLGIRVQVGSVLLVGVLLFLPFTWNEGEAAEGEVQRQEIGKAKTGAVEVEAFLESPSPSGQRLNVLVREVEGRAFAYLKVNVTLEGPGEPLKLSLKPVIEREGLHYQGDLPPALKGKYRLTLSLEPTPEMRELERKLTGGKERKPTEVSFEFERP